MSEQSPKHTEGTSNKLRAAKLLALALILAGGWLILSHYVYGESHLISLTEVIVGAVVILGGIGLDLAAERRWGNV